jgi:hypothetical protein
LEIKIEKIVQTFNVTLISKDTREKYEILPFISVYCTVTGGKFEERSETEKQVLLIEKEKLSVNDGETHMVYIGCVTSIVNGSHYDFREIFKEIAEQKIHLHMYVSIRGTRDKAYQQLAEENSFIHYHGHLDQKTLLKEITQYDYGWAGFNVNKQNIKHLDVALPNKTFEYVACGLPVLAFPHKTLHNFLERINVGFVFNNLDEMFLKLRSRKAVILRQNVLDLRHKFTVESNIKKSH